MFALGIVVNACFRFARDGVGAGVVLGGLYGALTAVTLAFGGGLFPALWLLPFGFTLGALYGGIAGLGAGRLTGLLVCVVTRRSRVRREDADRSLRSAAPIGAVGFGLVTAVGFLSRFLPIEALDRAGIVEILLFTAVPALVAALAGWWIGHRFAAWYALERAGSDGRSMDDGVP